LARQLVECVPNFSEGRNRDVVEAIADAILSVPGTFVLSRELDPDHNRSVITFVGPPETVGEAAVRAVGKAAELIDLTAHNGVHPRIGAADVVPFVPVEGVTLDDCVRIARWTGEQIWNRWNVPVYFYEAAATKPRNTNLENIRRGNFEGLSSAVRTDAERAPDVGGLALHPTAGATVVGARKFLIAFNINLGTSDLEIAKHIARAVRFSSGGLRYVKALGLALESRGIVQVSINLTDFEQTPIHRVFEMVRLEASRFGVSVVGSELIGLVPKKAIEMTAEHYLRFENFHTHAILENRLVDVAASETGLHDFLDALAAPTPAPAGGSASAAAAAMAAALGAMVARMAGQPDAAFEDARRLLQEAVTRDSAAYEAVVSSRKRPAAEREKHLQEALQKATLVPLEVMECTRGLQLEIEKLEAATPPRFTPEMETAKALAQATLIGALASVTANIPLVKDATFVAGMEERLRALK